MTALNLEGLEQEGTETIAHAFAKVCFISQTTLEDKVICNNVDLSHILSIQFLHLNTAGAFPVNQVFYIQLYIVLLNAFSLEIGLSINASSVVDFF